MKNLVSCILVFPNGLINLMHNSLFLTASINRAGEFLHPLCWQMQRLFIYYGTNSWRSECSNTATETFGYKKRLLFHIEDSYYSYSTRQKRRKRSQLEIGTFTLIARSMSGIRIARTKYVHAVADFPAYGKAVGHSKWTNYTFSPRTTGPHERANRIYEVRDKGDSGWWVERRRPSGDLTSSPLGKSSPISFAGI